MKRIIYGSLVTLVMMTGCTKNFLDINKDPYHPEQTSLNRLLPTAEQGLGYALGFTNDNRGARGLTEVLAVYMHQVTVRESPDQYGADGNEFNINGAWKGMYSSSPAQVGSDILGSLQNVEVIINQATEEGNTIYAGIGKVLKAYAISQMVDVFADVPFSEANKLISDGIRFPKYDKGADIYPQLFTLLDGAIADLNNADAPNTAVPSADDIIYGGDAEKWTKAANSIKLKLYNQVRLVQNVSTQVNALIASGNLISETSESFLLPYGKGTTPDDRNPGFNDYYAGQKTHYQSPWFYETLKGYHQNVLTNNPDPRLPYYMYRQLKASAAPQNPSEYRDGGFLSIVFGSVGPNRDWSQDQSMTVFGIYPVGGRYDDGAAIKVDGTSGTGAAPYKFLTYADVLYIEAELMHAGVATGDAKATFQAALEESFKQVDYVVGLVGPSQSVPAIAGTAAATTYQDKVMAEYDAKPAAGKLELIMTEKWIASFGSSIDQYTDYRRTGYPVLFNPKDPVMAPGGRFQPPINGDVTHPGAQPSIQVQLQRAYPLSLPWSNDDLNVNANAPAQKQPASYPVFWDK
ncbi:Starch-binding associating with outer membrane [Chitinophaga rupis]|uniref:Starch-binding associating with outer membrane n=1 Tax=Chitinophaga rupis TaxID=573321 RepID=A0A1H7IN00_9BACT|nr:SusD/RagB family nutrient-binding outer membrane lipoprotein [Chitinophaga rupis]SEK63859.1 Starch-binding associating with outer membrane [Chitinophaga rupis]